MTLFNNCFYDGVSEGIWVIHTGPKSGCKLVTLFDSYFYDGASAGIWVIHTDPKSGCKLVTHVLKSRLKTTLLSKTIDFDQPLPRFLTRTVY